MCSALFALHGLEACHILRPRRRKQAFQRADPVSAKKPSLPSVIEAASALCSPSAAAESPLCLSADLNALSRVKSTSSTGSLTSSHKKAVTTDEAAALGVILGEHGGSQRIKLH